MCDHLPGPHLRVGRHAAERGRRAAAVGLLEDRGQAGGRVDCFRNVWRKRRRLHKQPPEAGAHLHRFMPTFIKVFRGQAEALARQHRWRRKKDQSSTCTTQKSKRLNIFMVRGVAMQGLVWFAAGVVVVSCDCMAAARPPHYRHDRPHYEPQTLDW
eukprot:366159-Chlamydomonas_euryale.AAC.4